MTQDEKWMEKYNEVKCFMEQHHRNPSKYDDTERGLYFNWLRHNKRLYKSRMLKPERMEMFRTLMELGEQVKHKNQWV